MPVMNEIAFELSLQTAIALNCKIPEFTKWDRKQYYYPDLPKGYQVSQFDLPMSAEGYLEISDPKGAFDDKRVRITRAHLEEDAGKSVHDEVAGKADSEIDLNRTGTPLLEIVSEPDMRSSAEARAYLQELKLLLTYLGVSDCNMQEGSLRVDANVNLHIETPDGSVATPIVEIKNMNSFRAVERAIDYEAQRQERVWQETHQRIGEAPKQTRGWDDAAGVTRGQRSKEESSDYRYFPEPDLVPVVVTPEQVEEVRASLAERPAVIRSRLCSDYGLSTYDSNVIVKQGRDLVDYYLEVADKCGDGKAACNWVTQDVLRVLKKREISIQEFQNTCVSSDELAELITKVNSGDLTRSQARELFDDSCKEISQDSSKKVSLSAKIKMTSSIKVGESELTELCQELLDANPKVVADVQGGKVQAIGALIGQAKQRNPNVDPGRVREICLELAQKQ